MFENMKKFLLFFLFAILIVVTGILVSGSNQKTKNRKKISVTTSIYPLYYFTSKIAGDKAEVKNIIPAGAEPHGYEPTAQEIARIETSDLLVLNGGPIEVWASKVKKQLEKSHVKILTTGETLINLTLEKEGKTIADPHIWLSPFLAIKQTELISKALIDIDPENRQFYEKNQKKLAENISQLNNKYEKELKNCEHNIIITSHTAFGYLAKDYGLKQIALSGISPEEEPTAKQLAQISDLVKKEGIDYVFFETLVSPKLSNTIANEAGIRTLVLNPAGGISEQEIKQGKDYMSIMNDNLNNLKTALKCH